MALLDEGPERSKLGSRGAAGLILGQGCSLSTESLRRRFSATPPPTCRIIDSLPPETGIGTADVSSWHSPT
jgi:hypothetical protein